MHAMCRGSRGGTVGPDPPEKSQNIGFPSNIDPDIPKHHKATKPAFDGLTFVFKVDEGREDPSPTLRAIIGPPAKCH